MRGDSTGYGLYGGMPPHQVGRDTSLEAAKKVKPLVGGKAAQVLDCLRKAGDRGLTDREIQRALVMPVSTEVPRRRELVLKGLVKDSGQRRRTPTGYKATVWVIVDNGTGGA